MPGVSLRYIFQDKSEEEYNTMYDQFLNALNSAIYDDSYNIEILLKQALCILGCTRYSEYPVRIFENERFWVCLEGRIYEKSEEKVNSEINELVNQVFAIKKITQEDKKMIANWLLQTDGDFLIYALNKNTKDFIIMNDILGRLPLYYCKQENEMTVSRELPFMSYLIQENLDNGAKFDRMGIAQYLLTGTTMGTRTIMSNINRLEPATVLKISKNSEITTDDIYRINFEDRKYANLSVKKNARELVSLFSNACKNRAENNAKNIILLSGGFDSRCVLASFRKNKIQGIGATFLDPGWTPAVGNTSEADVAEKLAKSLHFELENYEFIRPRAKDLLKLLRIKNGFLYLAFSYLLPPLEKLKHKYGSFPNRIFTGHGGEIIRPDPYPVELKNLNWLVYVILHGNRAVSLSDVAALLKIKESEIINEVHDIVSAYPEKSINKKFMHYYYYELEAKLAFETEDLYRIYFWTASPFYSIPFFNYAMNCPNEDKLEHGLYKEFLTMLSPAAARISTSNWGSAVSSGRYKILQFVYSLMLKHYKFYKNMESLLSLMWAYPRLSKIITIKKDNRAHRDIWRIVRCVREQLNRCHNISNFLSHNGTEKILNNYSGYNRIQIYRLFTIITLLENAFCNGNTIEQYYDDSF